MGLENRGYMQDEPSFFGGPSSGSADRLIITIIIINVVVFLLQNMSVTVGEQVTYWLMLRNQELFQGQIWRVVTYGFCHGGFFHILFNMFNLYIFGRLLSQSMKTSEFLAFYLVAIVVGGLAQVVVNFGFDAIVIGASAGVSGLLLLAAMKFPRMKLLLMGIIPIELRWLAIGFFVLSLLSAGNTASGTAHAAHLGGAVFGIAYQYFHWNLSSLFEGRESVSKLKGIFSRKPKLKIHTPTGPSKKQVQLNEEVDRILAKIHEEGEASLTSKERKTLEKASKQYRQLNK
ncbi:Rhomboid protease GlpG [Polystyrenella longa]|uniref:Rhomboid protease GlpG n=1 Tax=Polystyrenella longa TaxID=2528007 RepID=A0A518CGV8_9PLAN|nr:rhomboid family intramembrane serine protease [Polystyrenella longa]QDU78462.1 Rhomboid protease GlpG [Polystyrenella longa]